MSKALAFAALATAVFAAAPLRADDKPAAAPQNTPAAADPTLTIKNGDKEVVFKRSELLARPDLETIDVAQDPAYPGKKMTYKAVRATALFDKVKLDGDAVIQFKCLDGFSAPISKERLLNKDPQKSLAYIAIETPDAAWPPVKPGDPSAGPFYLVWPKPQASFIGPEEWPFQLAAFEVKGSLRAIYPRIFPVGKKIDAKVQRGFAVFTKNCFACHTLNRSGAAEIGPDLNVPHSPTEYFTPKALKRQVRNPQDLRYFPKSRMSAFPSEVISDNDLDALVAYLSHMAKHKDDGTPKKK